MSTRYAVVGATWTRIRVELTIAVDPANTTPTPVTFVLVNGAHTVPARTRWASATEYRVVIDVATFDDRQPIPEGSWRLYAQPGGEPVRCSREPLLLAAARTFRYADDRKALTIRFATDDESVAIIARHLSRPYRLATDGLRATVRDRLASADLQARSAVAVSWYWLHRALNWRPRHRTRLLFASEMRDSLGGNLLRVRQRLAERGIDQDFAIRESFRTPDRYTIASSLRMIQQLAWADVVLVDDYFGIFTSLRPSRRSKIIQLWHAGGSFKLIGFSRLGLGAVPRLHNAHRRYTYAICGARSLVSTYAEAFGIEEEAVIPTGLPRVDYLLDPAAGPAAQQRAAALLPQLAGRRVVLFAPTFRGFGVYEAHYDYSKIDFDALADALPEDTAVLFRMHHFVREPVPIPKRYADRFFDVTGLGDTNDFLHAADLLVTDYSSIIFEFALLDKPMLFYAYDLDDYAASRGFYHDFASWAPGLVCRSFDELAAALRAGDFATQRLAEFRSANFDYLDTGSGDRVIDWLLVGEPPAGITAGGEPDRDLDVP